MPTPDTSNANVAFRLREAVGFLRAPASDGVVNKHWLATELDALADALEQQAGPTWGVRVQMAAETAYNFSRTPMMAKWGMLEGPEFRHYCSQMDAALRAAFPELAPTDDKETV